MAEFHRKIELQSPDDLQYLISNIQRAASAEIERALPSLPDMPPDKDDMRVVVERLVGEYVATTLRSLAHNVTVNGMAVTEDVVEGMLERAGGDGAEGKVLEEFEAFDAKLDRRTRELMEVEERLVEEVAGLRREVPRGVVEREREAWKGVGEDEEVIGGLKGEEREGGVVLDGGERGGEMGREWEKGVKGLERMVGAGKDSGEGATGIVAKKERAERAEAYALGKKNGR